MKHGFSLALLLSLFSLLQCTGREIPDIKQTRQTLFEQKIPYEGGERAKLRAQHYIISNERRIDMFAPYLKNLGGIYIGVGTDQNLTFAAWAKSEYVWLMDFDDVVVAINQIHIQFLKDCADFTCFKAKWSNINTTENKASVLANFTDPDRREDAETAIELSTGKYSGVIYRFNELNLMTRRFGFHSFHDTPEDYTYLRELAMQRRITAIRGDLTKIGTLQLLGKRAASMQLPVKVLYTSNAEEYFRYPQEFRTNILSLPVDETSLLVRTITSGTKGTYGFPDGERYPDQVPFHYNIQNLQNMQGWMRSDQKLSIHSVMKNFEILQKGFSRAANPAPAQATVEK